MFVVAPHLRQHGTNRDLPIQVFVVDSDGSKLTLNNAAP